MTGAANRSISIWRKGRSHKGNRLEGGVTKKCCGKIEMLPANAWSNQYLEGPLLK